MKFGSLTYREIRIKAEQGWLVIVPTGCTEQQGLHLPVDFDTWFVEQVCLDAAKMAATKYRLNALVLPALPFGPTPEHRNFGSGYIDIPQELHDALVLAILNSLAQQSFSRIIVWRGCGGHKLEEVIQRFNLVWQGKARAFVPGLPYYNIWCRIGDANVPSGHADSFATSIALYLRSHSVRQDLIRDPENATVDWDEPNLDFAQYSTTGVIGDPTLASEELGRKLWNEVVESVAQTFYEIAQK